MRVSRPGASIGLSGVNIFGPRLRFGGGRRRSSRSHHGGGTSGALLALTGLCFQLCWAMIVLSVVLFAGVVQYLGYLPVLVIVRAVRRERPLVSGREWMPWGTG
jgi:hypothetical protein